VPRREKTEKNTVNNGNYVWSSTSTKKIEDGVRHKWDREEKNHISLRIKSKTINI
jgi:predicted transposase YbfD/YdcC